MLQPGTIVVLLQFLYNAVEQKFGVLAAQNAMVDDSRRSGRAGVVAGGFVVVDHFEF